MIPYRDDLLLELQNGLNMGVEGLISSTTLDNDRIALNIIEDTYERGPGVTIPTGTVTLELINLTIEEAYLLVKLLQADLRRNQVG